MIDPAMVRPGRLDKLLYVDLPTPDERAEIVRTTVIRRKMPVDESSIVGIENIVRTRCDGYSGADLAALVREAAVTALQQCIGGMDSAMSGMDANVGADVELRITVGHFEVALENMGPSVSAAQRRKYEALKAKFAGLPVKEKKLEEAGAEKGQAEGLST